MKKTMWVILAVVVALLILPAVVVFAAPVGKITALEGRVDMTPAGTKEAVSVTVGTNVNTGDIIRAKSKSKAEVTFTDGNVLKIAENSRIRITQYRSEEGQKSYFNLFRGKTQVAVNNLKKGANFEVHTPTAICGVRGSIFISMYSNGQSSFVFTRGSGYGYNANQPDKIVTIPTKVMMVVPRADKTPLLRPASDVEIDKHIKDTTILEEKEKKETSQEEKKEGQGQKAEAKKEGVAETEEKEEKKAEQGQPKEEPKREAQKPVQQQTAQQQTDQQQPGQPSQPTTASTTLTSSLEAPPMTDPTAMMVTQTAKLAEPPAPPPQPPPPPPPTPPEEPKDNTPPAITYTSTPPSNSDEDAARLSYEANEKSDFQYRVDNGSWQNGASSTTVGSTSLTELSEGNHTFEVKATDALGNTSTKAYSWTTNYANGPRVAISPLAAVPTSNGGTDVDVNLSSTNTTYKYKVDNGIYQSTDPSFTIYGLGTGDHTLYAFGRDDAGKRGQETYKSFTIHRYDYIGRTWMRGLEGSDLYTEDVSGMLAGVFNQAWGSWKTQNQQEPGMGTPAFQWTSYSGKANDAADLANSRIYYWLSRASGTALEGTISGTSSEMTYLTKSILGTGSDGVISGAYTDLNWNFTDTGKGKYMETPLAFWGSIKQGEANTFMTWNGTNNVMIKDGALTGMLAGTTDLWASPSVTGLGSYTNPNNRKLYKGRIDQSSYDLSSGNFRGGFAGIIKPLNASDNVYPSEGFGYAIYIKDPASSGLYETGYLQFKGDGQDTYDGVIFPGIEMWKQTGTIVKTNKGTTSFAPGQIDAYIIYEDTTRQRRIYGSGIAGANGQPQEWMISGYTNNRSFYLQGQSWRIWHSESGGDFSETPGSTWTADYGGRDVSGGIDVNYEIGKVTGSIWNEEKIAGTVSGKHLGWQAMGTSSGQIIGNVAGAGNWQAVGGGASDSENLQFAGLIGNWTSSSREGASLIYSRTAKPVETIIIYPSSNVFPIRFNANWSSDSNFDSHTWIAPLNNSSRYYHIYYGNEGLTGPNKFRYPYAYLDDDSIGSRQENVRYYMFQPGKTYYAVHRYSSSISSPSVNVRIFSGDSDDNPITGTYSKTFADDNAYWSVFRINASLDPLAEVTVSRYDTYGLSSPMDLNSRVTSEGSIIGIMGGTQSVVHGATTADIPVRYMGSYTQATKYNRFWGQELIAYKDSAQQYITIDDGTFYGALGGSFRPDAKRVQGIFHTFAINSSGYAGLLRGSFGTGTTEGTDAGIIYPNIEMWEADGKVSRFDMNINFGYSPASLTGKWHEISGDPRDPYGKDNWWGNNSYLDKGHLSTWNDNLGIYEGGWGMFLAYTNPTYTQKAAMTDREDYLDIYKLKNDSANTFGVWTWRALGKYNAPSDYTYPKWIMDAEFKQRDGNNNEKWQAQFMAYGNAWAADGSFTGRVIGHVADAEQGFTGVAAGDTVGAYNDSEDPVSATYEYNTFGAVSTGSWINTTTFLLMMDDTTTGGGKEKLAALGYPTTEMILNDPTRNLTGDLASKPENAFIINNLRLFAPTDHDLLKIFATTSAHSRNDQTIDLNAGSLYPVTGNNVELPIYGALQANYLTGDGSGNWAGRLNVLGVFVKEDGAKVQAIVNGPVAGQYNASQFSGTTTGTFIPANFLSRLSDEGKRAYLKYYNGSGSLIEDGYLDGLLGPQNPVSWTEYSTYPTYTELAMTGVWFPGETAVQRSHVFNFPIYPTNFTMEPSAANRYTTSSGASFWGHLAGIHQVFNPSNTQDGFEARLATVFVDKDGKAGFLFGQIGGPNAWNPTSYWGFDFANQTFSIDTWQEKASLVEIGTTSVTDASGLKTYLSGHTTEYSYLGGIMEPATPAKIGAFFSGDNTTPLGAIYMETQNTPLAQTVTANYMDDGKWGVWSTDFFGTYQSVTHDYWLGEITTPEPVGEQPVPTKRMGATIYGDPWENNRLAGGVIGHWASVDAALTGITFGKLLGTFDPKNYTYQATAAGGFLETAQYLAMTENTAGRETLRSINVPCVQVGVASLTGTTGDLTVNMNDAKFFAFSTGQVPHIWATNSVNGNFTKTQPLNTTVNIAGSGLTADFTVKNWNTGTNQWMATVTNGQGGITGGGSNVQNLQFRGAAAGKINTPTSFSGTAAGVAKQTALPPPQ